EAYPELMDIKVRRLAPDVSDLLLGPGTAGAYHAPTNTIYLHANTSAAKTREVLLHEMMHAIQKIEGLAAGGSPASMTPEGIRDYLRLAGEVEARNVQARMNMSPKKLKAIAPWETADPRFPFEQQILKFNPEAKARMGDLADQFGLQMMTDEPAPLAPPVYSAVEQTIAGAKQAQAPGPRWLGAARHAAAGEHRTA